MVTEGASLYKGTGDTWQVFGIAWTTAELEQVVREFRQLAPELPLWHDVAAAPVFSLTGEGKGYLRVGVATVNLATREVVGLPVWSVKSPGALTFFSPAEWATFALLVAANGKIVPHTAFRAISPTALRMVILRVREKLGDDPRKPKYILAYRARGYALVGATYMATLAGGQTSTGRSK